MVRTLIRFNLTSDRPVQVGTTLSKIVNEQKRHGDRHRTRPEWNTLIAQGDPGAHINVFFVPGRKRDPEALGDEYGNIVCDDGMSNPQIEIAVPHMVGRFLGCPVIFDDQKPNYLMHSARAEGLNLGSGSFIPRDSAITMRKTLRNLP